MGHVMANMSDVICDFQEAPQGHRGGDVEEADEEDAEVPARRGGRHALRHPRQAQPEAGGKGTPGICARLPTPLPLLMLA